MPNRRFDGELSVIAPLTVGGVTIKNNLFLAPLAGVADVAFRRIVKEFGAGLSYTEMISCKGLRYKNVKTEEMLKTAENEDIKAVQLFGNNPDDFAAAVENPLLNKFDIIDINMGCPVPKVVNCGEGSALMKDLRLASSIIRACVCGSKKPVTVKFRKGFDEESVNAEEFALMCEESGASMITVHGRTRAQMYAGACDLGVIERVARRVKIPVVANGDVTDRSSAEAMLRLGAAAVMIGRAALGRPWVFSEILGGTVPTDIGEVILRHLSYMTEVFPETYAVVNMRKHIAWYVKGRRNASEIKQRVFSIKTAAEVKNVLNELL